MKKLFFTGFFSLYSLWVFPQYITLKGNQLYDGNGKAFDVKGINYIVDLFNASGSLTNLQPKPTLSNYAATNPTYFNNTASIKDIAADWRFIRDSLGCNTIRLCVGLAYADSCKANSFDFTVITDGNYPWGSLVHKQVTSLTFSAPIYQQLLDTAEACGMKVILLLWGKGASCDNNSVLESIYADYLVSTATALKNKKALLAYDEWNEPELSYLENQQPKSTVCNYTNQWYNLLKINDPNHLVTVGLWGPDVYNWGVDVYAADFYAIHVYLNTNKNVTYTDTSGNYVVNSILDYNNINAYKDRFNTFARYMQKVSSKPWMIGEASIGANLSPNYTDSTSADYYKKTDCDATNQAVYLTNLYTVVKQLGGMGALWWIFMDGIPNQYDINPEDPANNFYGLLSNSRQIKPAGYALKNFNASAVSGPGPNYPSNYQNLMGNQGNSLSGKVISAGGGGVPNAFVTGWHKQKHPTTTKIDQFWQDNIPTDVDGNFTITAQTPIFPYPDSTTKINAIEVGAAGYNIGAADSYAKSGDIFQGKQYKITKAANYDVALTAVHLSANSNYVPIVAPNILTLQDFYVSASAGGTVYTATATAGYEIAILPQGTTDSYVAQTAEAAIYNGFVFTDCSDPVWGSYDADRIANAESGKPPIESGTMQQIINEAQTVVKTVYLSPEGFLLRIFPNPANDKVLVQSAKNISFIAICSVYGNLVSQYILQNTQEQVLDVSRLAPGTYMIKIVYTDNTTTYTQIIKQ